MEWIVAFFDAFETEFDAYPETVQDTILTRASLLERDGPRFGRPHVDALTGSRHANMKELRRNVGGGIRRVLFAFGPDRQAILLAAGNKSDVREKRFYRQFRG